ncbi:hypothetical protein BW42_03106 [Exiguobacterium sp. RIT341]|nr:hypothetical protein BW42_03106 [Exiguobacterium sp. RIT341]
MLRQIKKCLPLYRFTIHVSICILLILSFHFTRQFDFEGPTVIAKGNQTNSFLEKDVLPLSSQASLFNPDGLYYQTLIHMKEELYQDFRSHPGIGMNYWNSLRDTRQEILNTISEVDKKDSASLKKLELLLNDFLLLIEIGEDKYEKILMEELQQPSPEADGMNWASDYTYIKDFLTIQRVWLYYTQKLLKDDFIQVSELDDPERKMYFEVQKNDLSKILLVSEYFFRAEPELNE